MFIGRCPIPELMANLSGMSRMNALKKRLLEFSSAAEWVKREGERVDDMWSCSKYWMTIARGEDICEKRGREVGWHVRLYQIIFSVTDVMFDLPWAIISKMHMKSGRERVVDMWIMIAGCKYLIPLDEMILDNTTSDVIFLLPLALCWTLTWRGRGRGSKTYNLTWCQA